MIKNKIKFYTKKTLDAWSLRRTERWLSRVENHLEGLEKIKNKNGVEWDIKEFERYIKLIKEVIEEKIKNPDVVMVDFDDDNDDISG